MQNLIALASAIIIGWGYIEFKQQNISEGKKYLSQALASFFIIISYLIISGFSFALNPTLLVIALISSILAEALPLYALQQGNLAINLLVFSSFPAFTLLFSFLINNEGISFIQGILVAITLSGISYLSFFEEYVKSKNLSLNQDIIWAVIAAIAVGLSDSISKNFIVQTSIDDFLFALAFAQIPVALLMIMIQKQKFNLNINDLAIKLKNLKPGILLGIGLIFFWYALTYSITGIASTINAMSGIFPVLLAIIFLKEIPRKSQWPGILLASTGVILLIIL